MVTPDGAAWAPRTRVDNAMVKALARAFRWRKMLDTGIHATIENLAKSQGIGKTYVSQILRLTLLAPDLLEAVLDGRQALAGCFAGGVSAGVGGASRSVRLATRQTRVSRTRRVPASSSNARIAQC